MRGPLGEPKSPLWHVHRVESYLNTSALGKIPSLGTSDPVIIPAGSQVQMAVDIGSNMHWLKTKLEASEHNFWINLWCPVPILNMMHNSLLTDFHKSMSKYEWIETIFTNLRLFSKLTINLYVNHKETSIFWVFPLLVIRPFTLFRNQHVWMVAWHGNNGFI